MDFKPRGKNIQSPKPNLKCSFCDYKTNYKHHLYSHIRSHTKERPYKCQHKDCSSAFSQKHSLDAHQLIHKKDDESLYKFKCSKCPYKTVGNDSLKRHLKTHLDVQQFSCDLCPYRSKHKASMTRHHESVHLKLKPFKCPQPNCNYACSQNWILNEHQMVHQDADKRASLLKFQCTECPFKTRLKGNLTQHLKVHLEVKKFACDLCPYRTKHKSGLNHHHNYVHSALKPFKCSQPGCNFSAKQSSDLTQHKNKHVDDKPWSCTFEGCGFTTKWKGCLKKHEMMHRGEKPFKCSLCPMEFIQMIHLNNHFRKHTGETPYPCPRCPFRDKSSSGLNYHLKRCKLKANEEVTARKGRNFPRISAFECKVAGCDFLTEQNSSLAIHNSNIHKIPTVQLTNMKI